MSDERPAEGTAYIKPAVDGPMTVGDLRRALADVPDNIAVMVVTELGSAWLRAVKADQGARTVDLRGGAA